MTATKKIGKATVTNQELNIFRANATAYCNNYTTQTVLTIALQRVLRKTKGKSEDYNDAASVIKIKLAAKDDKGNVIIDNQNYKYPDDKMIEMEQKLKELNHKKIEVVTSFIGEEDLPKDLAWTFRSSFEGFVIPVPEDEEEEEVEHATE